MLAAVKNIAKRWFSVPAPANDALAELSLSDRELVDRIVDQRLTYLTKTKLASLIKTCREIEDQKLKGVFVEAGCALGGSTILIANLKNFQSPLNVYDVFGIIPPPTKNDTDDVHDRYDTIVSGKSQGIGGDLYYGYVDNLYEQVVRNLESFGIDLNARRVSLIKGLLQETMIIDQPVAFAHIDVDWYDPVKTCLQRIYPKLVEGGSIILDDYHDWGGCRKAVDEYLSSVEESVDLDDSAGSLKITKRG